MKITHHFFHTVFFIILFALYLYALFFLAQLSDLHSVTHTVIRIGVSVIELGTLWLLSRICLQKWITEGQIAWWVIYLFIMVITCLAYVAQVYSIYISDNFVSIVAIQNIYYASFTEAPSAIVLLSVAALCIIILGIYTWRARHSLTRPSALSRKRVTWASSVVFVLLYVFLLTQQREHVSLEPDFRQTPLASLAVNSALAFRSFEPEATASAGANASCFTDVGAGQISGYPFEKNKIYFHPLPFNATRTRAARPNVIVIFTEGISARLIGTYGGRFPGLTPNIDRLAKRSMKVTDYYNHTAPTFRAVIGQTSSGYSFTGGDVWSTGANKTKLATIRRQTLATLLNGNGYDTYFFQPEHTGGAFPTMLASLGFKQIYTFETIASLLHGRISIQDPYNELDDQTLFRGLTAFLQSRSNSHDSKPFFIALYNIGTHAFIKVAKGGLTYGDGTNDLLNKLHNYDHALGEFLDYFYGSSYANDTIFVFTSDHATYPDRTYRAIAGSDLKPYFVDKIPLLIYDPLIDIPTSLDAHGRNSLDLAPTILQMMSINNMPNSFLGQSLFEKRSFPIGITAIGADFYITPPNNVYSLAEAPSGLKQSAACEQGVVRSFYAAEKENRIFKTAGSGKAIGELSKVHHVAMCSLDIINGHPAKDTPSLEIGTNATFGGWFATSNRRPLSSFKILLRGESDYTFAASDLTHRPDVIAVLGGDPSDNYGFAANSDFTGAQPGTYAITLIAQNGEHCSTNRRVNLRP